MRIRAGVSACVLVVSLTAANGDERLNVHRIPSDLTVPLATDDPPGSGRRVRVTLPDYATWNIHHVLYLPADWRPGLKYPVIVEYPGNGGYENPLGDKCTGLVEDCKLGYGISGGTGSIWVCLPFLDKNTKGHALTWWGDPDETAAYCRAVVAQVCTEFGGDRDAVVLCGFSRGALACGYIGLRDDETARLWRALIAHSHFDGVREWNYAASDAQSARQRLRRLGTRPLYVTHEESVADVAAYLDGTSTTATIRALPYPNHTDEWVLKSIPERAALREWFTGVVLPQE